MMSEEEMTVEEIKREIQQLWILAAASTLSGLVLIFVYFRTEILEMGFFGTNVVLSLMSMSLFGILVSVFFDVYLKFKFILR